MTEKKKLSIAHVHWGFPPTIGGVETHLALMLPKMVERGHQVSLLTCAHEGLPNEDDYYGVKICRDIVMDLNWLYSRGKNILESEILRCFNDFLEKAQPDIVHAHNMHYFLRRHTLTLEEQVRKRNIPLILTAHNVWDDTVFLELTCRVQWDLIIAVSHYIRSELLAIGCNPLKTVTIHHGIDTKKFKPGLDTKPIYDRLPQLKDRKVVIHPARMGYGKGSDQCIKAFNVVKKQIPEAVLVMGGSKNIIDWGGTQASDVAYIRDLINHFSLQDNVVIDFFTLPEMPALYNIADVVLYPSNAWEPFGMTMLESMACKKPIIVTRTGGMPEIIHDGVNGFVIPVRDYEKLAMLTIQLLKNPERCKQLGEAGYSMIQEMYTENHVTDNTLALYDKFI